MADEDTSDLPFSPVDDDDIVTPEADVAQAAASALSAGSAAPSLAAVATTEPTGYTWLFDYDLRRFVKHGGRPAEVRGQLALIQRVMLAIHTARFRYDALPNDFGFDRFDDLVGTVGYEEALSDFERRLTECVQSVPGCSDVQEFAAHADTVGGAYVIDTFTIITDTGEVLPVGPVTVNIGPGV